MVGGGRGKLKWTNEQCIGHNMGENCQTQLMVEICSKSLVRLGIYEI